MSTSAHPKNSTNVRVGLLRFGVGVAQGISPALAGRVAEDLFVTPQRRPRPPREQAWLREATPVELRVGERDIAAWAWGEGPTVLLVHGWEGRGAQLGAFAAPLEAAGFRVIAFDAPAHGATSGQRMTLIDLAQAILAAGERFGPLHAVVAHSLGAAAATVALSRGLEALRVVYLAPVLDVSGSVSRFVRWARLGADAELDLRRRLERRTGVAVEAIDGFALAPSMAAPLLVVHDRDDRQVAFEDAVRAVDRWPGARLLATRGLGHDRILRDQDVVARTLAFLSAGDVVTFQEELERELFDPRLRALGGP